MTSPDLPYRLRQPRWGVLVLVLMFALIACIPFVLLITGPPAGDRNLQEFSSSVKVALAVGGSVAVPVVAWFLYRVVRQSVVVEAERLLVRNLGRTHSIPLSELREVRGVIVEGPSGTPGGRRMFANVVALHGDRSIRIEAAGAETYRAEEFQAEFWAALEDISKLYRFEVVIADAATDA